MSRIANILTVAGSDSGGGAGVQADLKTIQALGAYGTCAITALTAQNGLHVTGIFPVACDFVAQQIATVQEGFSLAAAKTGMLFSSEIIETVARALADKTFPLVVDPVCMSQSGCQLMEDQAIQALVDSLLPLSDLLTPNIPEAEILTKKTIKEKADILEAGSLLLDKVPGAVLIKGGHLPKAITVTDYLFVKGEEPKALSQAYVATENNHGTGCTLSAAIATHLGQGLPLLPAVTRAQQFLNQALRQSYNPGQGAGPVNHACRLLRENC